jgi:predicted NBD/HSP70 family sugar kinase
MRITDQEANRLKVLKAIRRAEPVARTELVRLTGLASGSITEIVGDLVRRKALLEAKSPAVGRGRPRVQLYLNPEAGLVVGAFLLPTSELSVEISNARGDRLYERTTAMPRTPSIRAWAEQIGQVIDEVIEASPVPRARLRRIGLALPAVVDSGGGVVHWLQTYPQESVEVGAIVERRVGLPVTVDNGINVMARAEHWFGEDRQVDDFSLVVVGLSLGLAEYADGILKTGAHGINSEFGHSKISLDDDVPCTCGARGCIAAYATGYGVVARTWAARGLPRPRLRDMVKAFRQCVQDARAGEPVAAAAFDLCGRALGIAVANLINATDPARVLVLALDQALADLVVAPFYASLQENTLPALRGRTPVQLKVAEEARYSHGAAALVLEQLYRTSGEAGPATAPAA